MAENWPAAARRPQPTLRRRPVRWLTGLAGVLALGVAAGCGQQPADMAEPQGTHSSSAADAGASGKASQAAPSPKSSPSATSSASRQPSAKSSDRPSASSTAKTEDASKSTTSGKSEKKKAEKKSQQKKAQAKKAEPTPAGKALYGPGDSGKKVRELQARLQQLNWFGGELSDNYGPTTREAVTGFQKKRNLQATGAVDQKTWDSLTAMTKKPSAADLKNAEPAGKAIMKQGQTSDRIKDLQARLTQLDWFSEKVTGYYGSVTSQAVKGFQGKRGLQATGAVDQKTWDSLTGMTKKPTKSELSGTSGSSSGGSTAGLDKRCLTGRAICINKSTSQLTWVVDGKAQLHFDVRFGADTSPTREGSFSVGWKAKDWTSTLYHSEMPYSMFFSGGQAIHYSSDFAARGYAGASHGCVNVRDLAGIKSLFGQAQVGDKVIVYRS